MMHFKKRKVGHSGRGQFRLMGGVRLEDSASKPAPEPDPSGGTAPKTPGSTAPATGAAPSASGDLLTDSTSTAKKVFHEDSFDSNDDVAKARQIARQGADGYVNSEVEGEGAADLPTVGQLAQQRTSALEGSPSQTVENIEATPWSVQEQKDAAGNLTGFKISDPKVAEVIEYDMRTGGLKLKAGKSSADLTDAMMMGFLEGNSDKFGGSWSSLPESQKTIIVLSMQGRLGNAGKSMPGRDVQLSTVERWQPPSRGYGGSSGAAYNDATAAFAETTRAIPLGHIELSDEEIEKFGNDPKKVVKEYMSEILADNGDDAWDVALNARDSDWQTLYEYSKSKLGKASDAPKSADEEIRNNLSKKPEEALLHDQAGIQSRSDEVADVLAKRVLMAGDAVVTDIEKGEEISNRRAELENDDEAPVMGDDLDRTLNEEFGGDWRSQEALFKQHGLQTSIEEKQAEIADLESKVDNFDALVNTARDVKRLENSAEFRDNFRKGETDPKLESAKAEYDALLSQFSEAELSELGFAPSETGYDFSSNETVKPAKEKLKEKVRVEQENLSGLEGEFKGLDETGNYTQRMKDVGQLAEDLQSFESDMADATATGDTNSLNRLLNPKAQGKETQLPKFETKRTDVGDKNWRETSSPLAKGLKGYAETKKVFGEAKSLFDDGKAVYDSIKGLQPKDENLTDFGFGEKYKDLTKNSRERMKEIRDNFSKNEKFKPKERKEGSAATKLADRAAKTRDERKTARGDKDGSGMFKNWLTKDRQDKAQANSAVAAADTAEEKKRAEEQRNLRRPTLWA